MLHTAPHGPVLLHPCNPGPHLQRLDALLSLSPAVLCKRQLLLRRPLRCVATAERPPQRRHLIRPRPCPQPSACAFCLGSAPL